MHKNKEKKKEKKKDVPQVNLIIAQQVGIIYPQKHNMILLLKILIYLKQKKNKMQQIWLYMDLQVIKKFIMTQFI
jgi:hypothetical protein